MCRSWKKSKSWKAQNESPLSKDKDSQIVNDPNDWAREHDDPKYILNLLKSIITVSLETMKIVNALPPLKERHVA